VPAESFLAKAGADIQRLAGIVMPAEAGIQVYKPPGASHVPRFVSQYAVLRDFVDPSPWRPSRYALPCEGGEDAGVIAVPRSGGGTVAPHPPLAGHAR